MEDIHFCHFNGTLIPKEKAIIHVSDLGLLRGYGIFDYFRVEENIPLFLDFHLERFQKSAAQMLLEVPFSKEEIINFVKSLIQSNKRSRGGIRIVLTGGYSEDGFTPMNKPNFFILQSDAVDYSPEVFTKGLKLILHEHVREIATVKTLNYVQPILQRQRIVENDAFDILYHKNGLISETSRSNFFIVDSNNNIATSDRDILGGINRKIVLEIAKDQFSVEERPISKEEIFSAKEAFITSSTKRLIPVTQIDDILINNGIIGEVYSAVYEKFLVYEENYLKLRR